MVLVQALFNDSLMTTNIYLYNMQHQLHSLYHQHIFCQFLVAYYHQNNNHSDMYIEPVHHVMYNYYYLVHQVLKVQDHTLQNSNNLFNVLISRSDKFT